MPTCGSLFLERTGTQEHWRWKSATSPTSLNASRWTRFASQKSSAWETSPKYESGTITQVSCSNWHGEQLRLSSAVLRMKSLKALHTGIFCISLHAGIAPGWHLEYIDVKDEIMDKTFRFPCDRWLAKNDDDGQIMRELACANNDYLDLNEKTSKASTSQHSIIPPCSLVQQHFTVTESPFLYDRVWNLYHNWRHSWNQGKCLDCTWREKGSIKRICNGELLKEEEVLAVGTCCKINSVTGSLFAWKRNVLSFPLHLSLPSWWLSKILKTRPAPHSDVMTTLHPVKD